MRLVSFWFDGGLFALNVALGSILLGIVAFTAMFLGRRDALSLRHAFLTVALTVTLVSPLAIWITSSHGIGMIPFSLGSTDRREEIDTQTLSPSVVGDEKTTIQRPSLVEDSQFNGAATKSSGSTDQSTATSDKQTPALAADLLSADLAGEAVPGRWWGVIEHVGGVFAVVWAAVALCLLLRLTSGLLRVRQLQRSLRPAADPRLVGAARRALATTGHTPSVPVFESLLAPAPLTLGFLPSVIVMPEGLASSLGDEELACVLAHEAAHVARRDSAISLLQQLAGIGFWWNPLIRTASREISRIRERICDDHVVKQFGDGAPLARAIVKVAEWSVTRHSLLPLATNFLDEGYEMEQRLMRLFKQDRTLAAPLNRSAVVLIGLFGIVLAIVAGVPAVRGQVAPASSSATATQPKEGWQIQVRAVDAEGKPIAQSRFGVQLGSDDAPVWHDGDAQGRFVATFPKREPGYCYLLVRAGGFAPMRAFWRDALPAEFTFEMTKAVTVGGTVQDESGKSIAGATVLFSGGHYDALHRAESSFYQEKFATDEQGRWKCDLAPPNISSASIRVRHPDYANDTSNFGQDQRIPELLKLTHTWTMKRGFSVKGRVVDAEGKPIAGAALAIGELNYYPDEGPFQHTDADGRYRFQRVAPHGDLADDSPMRFTISVLKPGFMPVMESIPGYGGRPLGGSTKDERVVDLTLKRGATLKLRVVDAQNRPIKGVWIVPNEWHSTNALRALRQFGIPKQTDGQGGWQWTDVPPGESIGYDVFKNGYSDVRDFKIQVNEATVEKTIVLKQPQIITGTVIDAGTKQPIPEFIIERAFENVGGYPGGLFWATADATSGKNGTYRKQVTMPPHNGSYTYRARATGYEPSVSKSTPFSEGETTVNFDLQRKAAGK